MDEATRTELEAAAFRRLVEHLRRHTEVQNIDLMNLENVFRKVQSDRANVLHWAAPSSS